MWSSLLLLFRRQPGKSALASGGFLLTACALILLSATTQTTVAVGNQIIGQSWRSSYDLVVLPPQAKVPSKNTIPADLLAGYNGGISMQQYEQIKDLPGVEVAAPLASIGYIALPVTRIFLPRNYPEGYYELTWTVTAFNGLKQLVEYQHSQVVYNLPNPCQGNDLGNFNALEKMNIDYLGCGDDHQPLMNFQSPATGAFLLDAIDPQAESQLVHLDKSITTGRMLSEQDTTHIESRLPSNYGYFVVTKTGQAKELPLESIPMLIQQHLPGRITLMATFTQLLLGHLTVEQLQARGGASYLKHLPSQKVLFNVPVPLGQDDPQRFSGTELQWNGHGWDRIAAFNTAYDLLAPLLLHLAGASTPAGLTYQSRTGPDGQAAYGLVPTGVQGPEVAFRSLSPLHTVLTPDVDVGYDFEVVGQFSNQQMAAQFGNPLNWLPENTYTVPPVVIRYNAQGQAVPIAQVLPTTNQAGYLTQPPLALTTLAAAQEFAGNNIISAIRIRVSGINAADPASWKRIQQMATLIEQRTHLHVLVTLGSSPRPTLVYVPGVKQGQFGAQQTIAPIGWIEERWIAIGTSILYIAQLGAVRLLLIGAVLAVCLGYIAVSFSSLVTAQRTEFAILSALGWRPWQPARLFLTQALMLALVGGVLGLSIALLISRLLSATPIWLIVFWTLPTVLVLALLSSLYPLWLIWRIRPAEMLRAGASIVPARTVRFWSFPLWSFVPPLWALVMRNLARSRPRTLLTIFSLFLSTLLLVLMFSSILALRQTFTGTLLGNFVLLQTAVPQIAGCVFAVLLSFLSVTDLLLLQVRERQREIGLLQAIGWRAGPVRRMFVQEGIMVALIGSLVGVLVAVWILVLQHTSQKLVSPLLVALGAIVLMTLVAALATIPALRAINRMQVNDILRAE